MSGDALAHHSAQTLVLIRPVDRPGKGTFVAALDARSGMRVLARKVDDACSERQAAELRERVQELSARTHAHLVATLGVVDRDDGVWWLESDPELVPLDLALPRLAALDLDARRQVVLYLAEVGLAALDALHQPRRSRSGRRSQGSHGAIAADAFCLRTDGELLLGRFALQEAPDHSPHLDLRAFGHLLFDVLEGPTGQAPEDRFHALLQRGASAPIWWGVLARLAAPTSSQGWGSAAEASAALRMAVAQSADPLDKDAARELLVPTSREQDWTLLGTPRAQVAQSLADLEWEADDWQPLLPVLEREEVSDSGHTPDTVTMRMALDSATPLGDAAAWSIVESEEPLPSPGGTDVLGLLRSGTPPPVRMRLPTPPSPPRHPSPEPTLSPEQPRGDHRPPRVFGLLGVGMAALLGSAMLAWWLLT